MLEREQLDASIRHSVNRSGAHSRMPPDVRTRKEQRSIFRLINCCTTTDDCASVTTTRSEPVVSGASARRLRDGDRNARSGAVCRDRELRSSEPVRRKLA